MLAILSSSKDCRQLLSRVFGTLKGTDEKIQYLDSDGVFIDYEIIDVLNSADDSKLPKVEFKKQARAIVKDISKQFESQQSLNDRVVKTTGHIVLTFHPEDNARLIDKQFKLQIIEDYLEQMEIKDTQYVIIEHEGPSGPHIHIVYNRVNYYGTVISSKFDRLRSVKASEEVSRRHGLVAGSHLQKPHRSTQNAR